MKTADELAAEYASRFPKKSEWDRPERYSTRMLYEVRDEVEEAFIAGYNACMAQTFEHINRLQKALTKAIQQRDAEYSWMWSAYTRKELDEQIEEILAGNAK